MMKLVNSYANPLNSLQETLTARSKCYYPADFRITSSKCYSLPHLVCTFASSCLNPVYAKMLHFSQNRKQKA